MFLTRLGRSWLFCHNILLYHIPFLPYVVLLKYLSWTFITLPILLKCPALWENILPFIAFSKLHCSQVSQTKIVFYYIRNILAALKGLCFFGLIICFILFSFYSLVWFLEFWNSIYRLSNTLYLFFIFSWNCVC